MNPMSFPETDIVWTPMPGALPARHCVVDSNQLLSISRRVRDEGGRLVSLWAEDRRDSHDRYRIGCESVFADDGCSLS